MSHHHDLREQLRPWLDALQRHVELPSQPTPSTIDHALETVAVWLHWPRSELPDYELVLVYEALELLLLLSRVDYGEWLRSITSIWPRAVSFWTNAFYPNQFQLGVIVIAQNGDLLTEWAKRACAIYPELSSTGGEYARQRGQLEAALGSYYDHGEIFVPVCVAHYSLEFSSVPFEVVQLTRLQAGRIAAARSLPARRWSPLLRVVMVMVVTIENQLSTRDMLYLEEITACGVRVPRVSLSPFSAFEEPTAAPIVIACLQRMFILPATLDSVPVQCVEIDALASRRTLDSAFSSVLHSPTVNEIFVAARFSVGEGNCERLYHWLALCAFGRQGYLSLDTLSLIGTRMRDVETLERTLREDDALSRLFKTSEGATECTVASASTFLLEDPAEVTNVTHDLSITLEIPFEKLQVIAIDDNCVSVLLPGWGQAWLQRSDITLQRGAREKDALSPRARPLSALRLCCEDELVVLALLRLIGSSVKRLITDCVPRLPDGSFVHAMCLACPLLEELTLTAVSASSLDGLGDCYEEGTCHVSRLVIEMAKEDVDATDPVKLFQWLADETRVMTQHLRELHLTIHVPQLSQQVADLLSTAAAMLESNRFIWNLSVRFQIPSRAHHDTAALLYAFEATSSYYTGQCVAVRAAPVSVETKVALLSVLRIIRICCPEARDMDAGVVGLIFDFAAECKKRCVLVALTNEWS